MAQNGEPTVEEILESIKQVIARDNRAVAAQARHRRETEGVLELDEHADEDNEGLDVLDLTADTVLDNESASEAEGETAPVSGDDGPLLNASTQESMRDSLTALAMLSGPGAQPQIVRSGETSVEGLVREMLRPALAEWLDKNLPPLVERMVAAEIKRIAGKKG